MSILDKHHEKSGNFLTSFDTAYSLFNSHYFLTAGGDYVKENIIQGHRFDSYMYAIWRRICREG